MTQLDTPLVLACLLGGWIAVGSPARGTCEAIAGADELTAPGTVLMIGEMHGTAEIPAAIGQLACRAAERGLAVGVGLEIPVVEQGRIDRFVAGEIDRDGLLAGAFWTRTYQDGRSSAAMADLLTTLRDLHHGAPSLRVVALDVPEPPDDRDRAMAANLRKLVEGNRDAFVVSLTGNLHNRLTRGTPFAPQRDNMGQLLRAALSGVPVRSLIVTYGSGSAWTCTSAEAASCQERELGALRGRGDGSAGIHLWPTAEGEEPAFSGELAIGAVSASRPARLAGS